MIITDGMPKSMFGNGFDPMRIPAEEIRSAEIMIDQKNTSLYYFNFLDLRIARQGLIFIEVTSKSGKGLFTERKANTYLYKPLNYGYAKSFYSPKYTAINKSTKKPDFRSTVYWNPNVVTDESGKANVSFFSADKKGTYTIWVEGTDLLGHFGFKTMQLSIR